MTESVDLILCGKSLFMAGLEASLNEDPSIKVVRLDTALFDSVAKIDVYHPGAVIFEANPENMQHISEVINTHTGLTFMGLDTETHQVTVYSCEKKEMVSAAELKKLILG